MGGEGVGGDRPDLGGRGGAVGQHPHEFGVNRARTQGRHRRGEGVAHEVVSASHAVPDHREQPARDGEVDILRRIRPERGKKGERDALRRERDRLEDLPRGCRQGGCASQHGVVDSRGGISLVCEQLGDEERVATRVRVDRRHVERCAIREGAHALDAEGRQVDVGRRRHESEHGVQRV